MKHRHLSFKTKLRIIILFVTIVTLIFSLIIIGYFNLKEHRKLLIEKTTVLAKSAAYNLDASLIFVDPEAAATILKSFKASPNVLQVVLFDKDGNIFARYNPGSVSDVAMDIAFKKKGLFFSDQRQQKYMDYYQPIVSDEKIIGVLFIRSSLDQVFRYIKQYTLISLLIIIFGMPVILIVSELLQRIITGPLLRLTKIIHGIQETANYATRVEKNSEDEIGALITDFNKMLEVIESRDLQLKNHQATLEQQIKERTSDLLAAKEKAEQANEAKSQFLSSMSHELRTPLNAILGFSQLIQSDENLTELQVNNINEIYVAGEHLLELVNNVLDLASIEAGSLTISIEQVSLNSIVEECHNFLKFAMEKKPVGFSYDDKLIETVGLKADAFRLKQVLLNLLSNAIKYNKPNGNISLNCIFIDDKRWRIEVIDTGFGIPENKLVQLFKPFDRLGSETSTIEGTGIGLTITKTLVELMGGRIGVVSKPEQGSTFWFELDGYISQAKIVRTEKDYDFSIKEVEIDSRKVVSILYADDNEVNRLIVKQAMNRLGNVNYITAENGADGLEKVKLYKPDLILLDIHMPEISGNELCRILKNRNRNTPIIAISADAGESSIKYSMSFGFDDYITKPFNMNVLIKILNSYIQQINSRRNT